MTKTEMIDRGFDPAKVHMIGKKNSTNSEERDQYYANAQGYMAQMYSDVTKYSVYWHFTIYE
jgi:hypothetical protein